MVAYRLIDEAFDATFTRGFKVITGITLGRF